MVRLVHVSCENCRNMGSSTLSAPHALFFCLLPQQDSHILSRKRYVSWGYCLHNQVAKAEDVWATKLPILTRLRGTNEGWQNQDGFNLNVCVSVCRSTPLFCHLSPPFILVFLLSQSLAQAGWLLTQLPRSQQGRACFGGWKGRGSDLELIITHGLPCSHPSCLVAWIHKFSNCWSLCELDFCHF